MKNKINLIFAFICVVSMCSMKSTSAQNPFIRDQFTADPSARVFNGKVYVFPSHDIQAPEGNGLRKDWFCMEDYHVFSSENLTDWTDHGMIVSQYDADWVDATSYSMWAPDCVERNGKYYFYFPSNTKADGPSGERGFGIGVAVADKPEGPYVPQEKNIEGVHGIDPNVLIDKDGQAYLYWSQGNIFVAKLKDNMLELDSEPMIIPNLPEEGLKEGPWVFERNDKYYLTFPHVENKTERLEYAIGDHPMGPFEMTGVIMDESPVGCWTNHHSVIEYKDQWYLFYHHNDYSPQFDKNRSVRIDSLFFNADGTIQKVAPTLRGVGVTPSNSNIEIDRYSAKSENASIEFLNPENTFDGWKTIFEKKGDWISYNSVDFKKKPKTIQVRVKADNGGVIQVVSDNENVIAKIEVPANNGWKTIETKTLKSVKGVHNLKVEHISNDPVEIDWIQFDR
ncbi:family 43 glycosylhydrolase [uncultured Draconibacterium sp.]|uniref:family 43 glycosylhydrolase n=1 Tax=uncultured Draconibacterium sp. TaxID=1573823 RepID=UPI0025FA4DF9|nr:family 43 glycosylhydrolase [uncultured Draconibacterium sp.]